VGLPPGVMIKTAYDRSDLIERSVHTLRHTLIEEMIVVGLVCILFLLHLRSELVAVFVVPSSVVIALLVMHLLGINANAVSGNINMLTSGDRIQFSVETNGPGYLYIVSQGSSGTWKPMFPSPEVEKGDNRVEGFHTYTMPPGSRTSNRSSLYMVDRIFNREYFYRLISKTTAPG